MNILFVCSRNKWRSRTAETIFKNNGQHHVRSAGTEPSSRIKISATDLNWASVILVMEDKHRSGILRRFPKLNIKSKIEVLGIPDDYQYMDAELIEILEVSAGHYFDIR